jgi:hypothetical protein
MYHQIKSDLESGGRRAKGGGENPLLAGQCLLHFRGQRAIYVANGVRRIVPHHHRLGTYLALPGLACFHLGGRAGGRGSEDGKDTIKRSIVR